MSKIEAGKLELNPIHYDFPAFLDNISSMFKYVAEDKNVEFRFEKGPNLPDCLFGDDIRLRQVLTNICGNALKFTKEGYVRLRVSRADKQLLFEVKDTGVGIRKEEIARLFSAFAQADAQKNRNIVGTGLGLAISRAFVQMMGGEIAVNSEYGEGSVFTIMIPLIEGNKEEVIHNENDGQVENMVASGVDVLVVDDNAFNLKVAQRMLNMFKIDAQTASSGKEAIELVRQNHYDIVFMDHMMPEMDGVETVAEIRKLGGKYETTPIIALTANAIHGVREMFLANGFNGFVSKPIDLHELILILMRWLPADKIKLEIATEDSADASEGVAEDKQGDFLEMAGKISELNTEIGLSRFSGAGSMYREAVEFFCNGFSKNCDKLTALLESKDIKGFAISVHAMKSELATIGAMKLSEKALRLETDAKNGEMDICLELFPDFREKVVALHEKLSALFHENEDDTEKEKGDLAHLRENIQKAREAAENFDQDAGMEAIKDLLSFTFGEQTDTLLKKALSAFTDFDFDGADEILNEFVYEDGVVINETEVSDEGI
jgi:CheY-like chemotaxis protein